MTLLRKILLACAPLMLVAACGGGDDSLDDRLDIADPKVRFIHAIPLGPNVDLTRNGSVISGITNVPYRFASNYFDVDGSAADWAVRTTVGNLPVGSINFNPSRGDKYTLVAIPGDATTPNLLFIHDPYNKSLTSNNARVRVVNASFNATSIDVYLTPTTTDITTVGPNFGGVGFRGVNPGSGTDSADFGANNYTLTVTNAGTKNVIFNAPISVAQNADLLLLTLPNSVLPGDVKVLAVVSDSATPATEIFDTP